MHLKGTMSANHYPLRSHLQVKIEQGAMISSDDGLRLNFQHGDGITFGYCSSVDNHGYVGQCAAVQIIELLPLNFPRSSATKRDYGKACRASFHLWIEKVILANKASSWYRRDMKRIIFY